MKMRLKLFQRGFSLVELMIVVAIIGILAAVAAPSYLNHIRKGHRTEAQAYMMDLAQRQQQYFTDSRTYAATEAALGVTRPSGLSGFYQEDSTTTPTIEVSSSPPGFTITFTAIGTQIPDDADGKLTLTNQGVKAPAAKW